MSLRPLSLALTVLLVACVQALPLPAAPPAGPSAVPGVTPLPVAPATPCPSPPVGAGPLAVLRTASAPPAIGLASSPAPTGFASCGPCQTLAGRVYDRRGKPIAGRATLFARPLDESFAAVAIGEIVDGAYAAALPSANQGLMLAVSAPGHATRERAWPPRSGYGASLDFGGPLSGDDPDAPAYYMPDADQAGEWRNPAPLPRPGGTVTSLTAPFPFLPPGGLIPRDVLVRPLGLVAWPGGGWAVADGRHQALMRIGADGAVTRLAGRGDQDGPAAVATFQQPVGVAVDAAGTVYVVDRAVPRVRTIDKRGRVATLAGSAQAGYANGPGATARFGTLVAITLAPDGTVYVADESNHRIRRISPAGEVSDAYGAPTNDPDGAARLPAVDGFMSLAVGADGAIYTAAQGSLYRIAPDGQVAWLAGTGQFGMADGPGPEARLNVTFGLAVAPDGSVTFSDGDGLRLRRWAP